MNTDHDAVKDWLQRNVKFLASFDLNRDQKIQPEEMDWALKTVDKWTRNMRPEEAHWRLHLNKNTVGELTWLQLGRRTAGRPMTFVSQEGEQVWLPWVVLLRAQRPLLPKTYELDLGVALSTLSPEDGGRGPGEVLAVDRLCSGAAVADALGSYSAPKDSVQDGYLMEVAITQHQLEQDMRLLARERGAKAVYGIERRLLPAGKCLHMSLVGSIVRP